eukprot:gnl/MRDRNA2_/MRDRNA2_94546_c0_seq1.p1 gnl/MRDRNA2_/MRDRNA2_94546_c0~~gnl/MRDRNA2_/MRDRNA2_94546_c0_seq1.p1  ORF type:complete len:524 (+),score=104.06 gnl/MRDRNA2_/MRDRNA2_94546_c0_seq1:85-1656(+)
MAWVFLLLFVRLNVGIETDALPGGHEGGPAAEMAASWTTLLDTNSPGQVDLLRRESSSGSLSETASQGALMKSAPNPEHKAPWMWAETGDDNGLHHSPDELKPFVKKVQTQKAEANPAASTAAVNPNLEARANQPLPSAGSMNPGVVPNHVLKAGIVQPSVQHPAVAPQIQSQPPSFTGHQHAAGTPKDIPQNVPDKIPSQASDKTNRLLESKVPAGLAGSHLDPLQQIFHERDANNSRSEVQELCPDGKITVACLTGASTVITTTLAPTPRPPMKTNNYQGNGQTGKTSGEMNTHGFWNWGWTVYADGGNGGWQWVETPDGDWNLVWVTTTTNNHWVWLMPNRYHWSGMHRRRGTWMHIKGTDWRDSSHSLANHMFPREDDSSSGNFRQKTQAVQDDNWSQGMTNPLAERNIMAMKKRQSHVENDPSVDAPWDMPTEQKNKFREGIRNKLKDAQTGNAASLGASLPPGEHEQASAAAAASIAQKQNDMDQVAKMDPLEAMEKVKNEQWKSQPLIYGSMAQKS